MLYGNYNKLVIKNLSVTSATKCSFKFSPIAIGPAATPTPTER